MAQEEKEEQQQQQQQSRNNIYSRNNSTEEADSSNIEANDSLVEAGSVTPQDSYLHPQTSLRLYGSPIQSQTEACIKDTTTENRSDGSAKKQAGRRGDSSK